MIAYTYNTKLLKCPPHYFLFTVHKHEFSSGMVLHLAAPTASIIPAAFWQFLIIITHVGILKRF